jgi:hypothetical protein
LVHGEHVGRCSRVQNVGLQNSLAARIRGFHSLLTVTTYGSSKIPQGTVNV